jgi:hypothetical protein
VGATPDLEVQLRKREGLIGDAEDVHVRQGSQAAPAIDGVRREAVMIAGEDHDVVTVLSQQP